MAAVCTDTMTHVNGGWRAIAGQRSTGRLAPRECVRSALGAVLEQPQSRTGSSEIPTSLRSAHVKVLISL